MYKINILKILCHQLLSKTHNNWFYPSKNSQMLKNLFEFFFTVSKKMILATMLLYNISDMSC